jgi:hypothetical protein
VAAAGRPGLRGFGAFIRAAIANMKGRPAFAGRQGGKTIVIVLNQKP